MHLKVAIVPTQSQNFANMYILVHIHSFRFSDRPIFAIDSDANKCIIAYIFIVYSGVNDKKIMEMQYYVP